MTALVERIIAARDALKGLNISDYALIRDARDAMADAANAITERDETIFYQRKKLERFEALLKEAHWYVSGHQEAQPNDETATLLDRMEFALPDISKATQP